MKIQAEQSHPHSHQQHQLPGHTLQNINIHGTFLPGFLKYSNFINIDVPEVVLKIFANFEFMDVLGGSLSGGAIRSDEGFPFVLRAFDTVLDLGVDTIVNKQYLINYLCGSD